jgi:CRISPR-associated protein Csb2
MGLAITIDLLTGGYEATDVGDRERAEWPPHPARVFSALRAGARDDVDRAALGWLEQQPPPVVVAAERVARARRATYVVTNVRSDKGGSQFHPGRTNGLRVRSRAVPAEPRVTMIWPGRLDEGHLQALDAMARRLPYLGRSTGIALAAAAVHADDRPIDERPRGMDVFEPCDMLDGEVSLRVPYPGFTAELDAQFAAGRPAWEAVRYRSYRRRPALSDHADAWVGAGADGIVPSVYRDVVVFQFSGLRPQPQLAAVMTKTLRSAVLRAAREGAPAALHGHGADGRPHVAFLALPDVGHPHADGHLLGLAVAIPDLPEEERAAVLRAVLGLRQADRNGLVELAVPRLGMVDLSYQPGLVRPWGASPQRWRRGSRRWVSATPVVLDRYPRSADQVAAAVQQCLATVGLPEAVDVQVSREPLLPGGARLRPLDLPEHVRGRLFQHVAVTFDRRVSGPVLVGAGRYLGVGLLAPVPMDGDDA